MVLSGIAPGFIIQFPVGNPDKITLPVADAHVGCVINPIVGGLGTVNAALIKTLAEGKETHLFALVTVKVCGPGVNPEIVVDVVLPLIPPGFIVQFPEGKPDKMTLPVAVVQVGCVIVPTVGGGFEFTVMVTDF